MPGGCPESILNFFKLLQFIGPSKERSFSLPFRMFCSQREPKQLDRAILDMCQHVAVATEFLDVVCAPECGASFA